MKHYKQYLFPMCLLSFKYIFKVSASFIYHFLCTFLSLLLFLELFRFSAFAFLCYLSIQKFYYEPYFGKLKSLSCTFTGLNRLNRIRPFFPKVWDNSQQLSVFYLPLYTWKSALLPHPIFPSSSHMLSTLDHLSLHLFCTVNPHDNNNPTGLQRELKQTLWLDRCRTKAPSIQDAQLGILWANTNDK